MILRLLNRIALPASRTALPAEATGIGKENAFFAVGAKPSSTQSAKNTIVFTCTRTDSQYVIHELLPAESPAPIFLFSSRSQAHFDALMSDARDFRYRFQRDDAENLLPRAGYDPIRGPRSVDEIIERFSAFEPMGKMTEQLTRAALAWISKNNLAPSVDLLIRLLSTTGVVEKPSNLPPSDPAIPVENFRREHLADESPRSAATGVKRYFDALNATIPQGWLTVEGYAGASQGLILRVDTKNTAHRFQMQGILRDHLDHGQVTNAHTPVMILDESDRFIPPALLLRALRSVKIRVVFMPENPDGYFAAENSAEMISWFGKVIWFRSTSETGKSLFHSLNPSKKCVGTAYAITCDSLDLNARIIHEKGVNRFENLIAKRQLATRAPFAATANP